MDQFDSLIIGEVAQDTNVDYDGTTVHAVGGAVYYSGFAAPPPTPATKPRCSPRRTRPRWIWPPPSPRPPT